MKTLGILSLGAFVTLVLLASFVSADASVNLVFGWITFLWRVVPRMTCDWPSVAVGGAAITLFAAGVHAIGRRARRPDSAQPTTAARWRIRWTLTIVAVIFLLFAAGIVMVGITHQIGWLATSRKPITVPGLARSTSSSTNLHMIAMALGNYRDTFGSFPAGGTFAADGSTRQGWAPPMLFFMGYSPAEVRTQFPWNHPENEASFKCVIPEFINPSLPGAPLTDADGYGLNHYAANCHVLGANRGLKVEEISDGAANTLLVGEINANFKPWAHPLNFRDPARGINRLPDGFGGPRSAGGANFAMVDGSVHFISERVDAGVLRALSTPAGGEAADEGVLQPER